MCVCVFCLPLVWCSLARGEEEGDDYHNNEWNKVVTPVVCGVHVWMCVSAWRCVQDH